MQYVFSANRDKKGAEVLVMSECPRQSFFYKRNIDYKTIKFQSDMHLVNFENFMIKSKQNSEILFVEAKNYKQAFEELAKLGYKYLPTAEKPKIFRTKSQIF